MTGTSMANGRLLRAYLTEARYECIRAFRAPGFIIAMVVLPPLLYLFFGVVLAEPTRTAEIDLFVLIGFAVLGVMGPGLFGFGVFVAMEREHGLLLLKRALPMPPAAYLIAKMAMTMFIAALVTLAVLLAAAGAGKVSLTAAQWAALGAITVTGALPFCAMGLFIGSRAAGRSAAAFVNLLYLPMIYLSGFLIPLPPSLHMIQVASPAYHLDRLALRAVGMPGATSVATHAIVLVGVTALFGWLAMRRLVEQR
jgi:ABC-2 type transport system permease protein